MHLKRRRREGASRLEFLDTVMDSHMDWRAESRAVAESYRDWSSAAAGERNAAFHRYAAALDREEQAAHCYRRVVELTHHAKQPTAGLIKIPTRNA